MSGLLTLNNYRKIPGAPLGLSGNQASVLLDVPGACYVTTLILYEKSIIAFKTTETAVSGEVSLTFDVPDRYDSSKISVFPFSHQDGYTNKSIGKTYWGVWFHEIGALISFHAPIGLRGAQLLMVPLSGEDLGLRFSLKGSSIVGHGEIV